MPGYLSNNLGSKRTLV